MATFVLSAIGSDRPGLTETLAGAVLAAGGNWLESHLSRLGGLYVGSVLVELAAADLEALQSAVREVDAEGLEVRIAPTIRLAEGPGEDVYFTLVGHDRPGIVRQVTGVFGRLGANIEALDTRLSAEANSGASLFHMEARLRVPPSVRVEAVQAALEGISAEIMVDISLTPVDRR